MSTVPKAGVRVPDFSSVFILGPPRSGTSLVYKVMCLHPETSYISNWVARAPKHPRIAFVNRIGRRMPKMRGRTWFDVEGNAYVYGSRRSVIHRAFPKPVEGEPVYEACGIDKAGGSSVREESVRLLAERVSRIRSASGGGTHFVNKRVANNRRVELLAEAFPNAKFVAVVRDGRAVAFSLSRVDWWPDSVVWWNGTTPREWEDGGGDPWELCAQDWVHELDAMESGLDSVPDASKLLIRYEDLIVNPKGVLAEIAGFVGLPSSREWDERLDQLAFSNRNTTWRERLPDDAARTITHIQEQHLQRFGYPL